MQGSHSGVAEDDPSLLGYGAMLIGKIANILEAVNVSETLLITVFTSYLSFVSKKT
jgi:hypothetical protein